MYDCVALRNDRPLETHILLFWREIGQGGQNIFAELDSVESRRFFPENDDDEEKEEEDEEERDEERELGLLKVENNAGLTSPTFTWKPEDFESAKALIMLKGSMTRL